MQDTLPEGTARAAQPWHLQRSPPAQSEDLPPEVWLPTLSDDERLLDAARARVLYVFPPDPPPPQRRCLSV
jgi:hypothetical protein